MKKNWFTKALAFATVGALAVGAVGCGSTASSSSSSSSSEAASESSASTEVATEASASATGSKGTIGILMPTLGAEFFTTTANDCKAAVEAQGYSANIQSFEMDANKAVEVIENFISDGVVGIAYMTVDSSGDDALKEAMDQGIAVLTCGAENENYDICQIADNAVTGYQVGQMAVDYINANLDADAQIAIVGSTGNQNMIDRTNGIKQALEDAGLLGNVVYEGDMQEVGDGTEFAENLNTLYPDCQVVVCYSDTYAAEISEVFSALNYPSTAAIFGHDGETKVLSDIANGGYIKGTFRFGSSGEAMGEGIIAFLNGEEGYESGTLIVLGGDVVTPENVSEFYTE